MNDRAYRSSKTSAASKAKNALPIPQEHLLQMVNEAAYYCAERRSFLPGYELLDWLKAEEQILGKVFHMNVGDITCKEDDEHGK